MDPVKETKLSTPKAKLEKRSNGQGSIYYITDKKGRRVLMAAIYDINGKRRKKFMLVKREVQRIRSVGVILPALSKSLQTFEMVQIAKWEMMIWLSSS